MKTHKKKLSLAIEMALVVPCMASFSLDAQALTITQNTGTFNDNAVVTATTSTPGNSSASVNSSLANSFNYNQFNSAAGVLMNITLSQSGSTVGQTIAGVGTNHNPTGSLPARGTASIISGSIKVTLPSAGGAVLYSYAGAPTNATGSCTSSGAGSNCSYGPISNSPVFNADFGPQNLNAQAGSFIGNSTIAVQRQLLTSTTDIRGAYNSGSATQSTTWSGNQTLVYDYQTHAAPSFNASVSQTASTINLGTWLAGSNPAGTNTNYTVFNQLQAPALDHANQADMDLTSVAPGGGAASFNNTVAPTANIDQSQQYAVGLTAGALASAGSHSATYNLSLADAAAQGIAGTHNTYNNALALTVQADVIDHSSPSFGDHANGNSQPVAPITNLTLNLGTAFVGASSSTNYSLWNLAGNRVGVDLNSISPSGNVAQFNANGGLSTFADLSANASNGYTATFSPTATGGFTASYTLALADNLTGVNNTGNGSTFNYILTLEGDAVDHALPSFGDHANGDSQPVSAITSLSLDLGTVIVGNSNATTFNIWNLLGDRVGVDLLSISQSGDVGQFNSGLATFSDLLANSFNGYTATFTPTASGVFDANYVLNFIDNVTSSNVAGTPTTWTYNLHLHGVGQLDNQPSPAPAPGSLMLVVGGLMAMRWRKHKGSW